MKRFRTLAVDDEPLAREVLCDLLAEDPEVELVGACGDGAAALAMIRELRPDVVFLDVEMPEMGGLEVAGALAPDEMPAIVFVTAYGRYAASAFEVEVLDYVVKPFSDERFFAALERAKRRVRERRLGELAEQIASLAGSAAGHGLPAEPAGYLTRIPLPTGGRQRIVPVREVLWIGSEDYYARVHTAAGARLVRASLAWFEKSLDPRCFVRVHRKAIVNVGAVVALEPLTRATRAVLLSDGTRLPVSRARRRAVEEVLAPRLGRGRGRRPDSA